MGDVPEPKPCAVKAAPFSFMQMEGAEPMVGVEMRSTGEVACFGKTLAEAMSRALIAAGLKIPSKGETGIILADEKSDLDEAKALLEEFKKAGIDFVTTESLAPYLGERVRVASLDEMLDMISRGKVATILSLSSNLNKARKDLYKVRRKAVELQVPFLTTVEEGQAVLLCVRSPLKTLS
jgi:carbamoyl-phosphate synthase large subunit